MTPFLKAFVANLRSGKFEQCYARLIMRRSDQTLCHCAMGVACETMKESGVPLTLTDYPVGDSSQPYYNFDGMGFNSYVPDQLLREQGLAKLLVESIMVDNDLHKLTFAQIADKIETEEYDKEV